MEVLWLLKSLRGLFASQSDDPKRILDTTMKLLPAVEDAGSLLSTLQPRERRALKR